MNNAEETKRFTSYFRQLQKERNPFYLTLVELQEILKWKHSEAILSNAIAGNGRNFGYKMLHLL